MQVDEGGQVGDREGGTGQVVEVVLGLAGLVDEDHGVWRRAVDERKRHRRVGRVVERALTLDDHPITAPLALLDEPLDRPLGEVADQPIDRDAPALDHHPGLAGRDERGGTACGAGGGAELQRDRHLADCAVGSDREDDSLVRTVKAADGRLHPSWRPAVVDDRRSGCRRGAGELGVVRDERM